MLIDQMKPAECEEMLARVGFGRLACERDHQPYIVPIYFGHQPGHLYGFSTVGRKIEWMRSNSRVCVQVDEVSGSDDWASVVALGEYEELPDTEECNATRKWAQSLLERRSWWWQAGYAASQVRSQPDGPAPVFYRINIRELTGLRASPGARVTEILNLKS